MSPVRIAVIGVGSVGQHHARILAAMPHADLVGVVDIKPDRAREVAAQYGTTAYSNASELVGRVDAVSIATPTVSHVAVALPFVESGAAVLVEKPLAATVEDADPLLAATNNVPPPWIVVWGWSWLSSCGGRRRCGSSGGSGGRRRLPNSSSVQEGRAD